MIATVPAIGLFDGQGTDLITGNIFTLVGAMFSGFGNNVRNAMQDLMAGLLGEGFVSAALGWLSSLSAIMIIGLAILFSVFKIFLELLKSYIAIILQVVFAPVILMVGAIPGQNTFLSWIKNLTGNLIMWPLTLICLLVNRMLTNSAYVFNDAQIGGFMPPYLLGTGQGAAFPALVGIGILLVIPEIMKEAKKKLGVSDGIMGNLAGAAFKQVKESLPLSSRAVGGLTAGVGGGLGGGIAGGIQGLKQRNAVDDPWNNVWQKAKTGFKEGATVNIGKKQVQLGGFKPGVKQGVEAGVKLSKSIGARQPDILNPVTDKIEDVANINPKLRSGQRRAQEFEDLMQGLGAAQPVNKQDKE